MSLILENIGIKGYELLNLHCSQTLDVHVAPQAEPSTCLCCGGVRLRSKGRYLSKAQHLSSFGEPARLLIHTRRFRCLDCLLTFVPALSVVRPGRHSTEPFRGDVYRRHHDGVCASVLARAFHLGAATVERIYHQFTARKARERIHLQCPLVLGIDEHTLHKGIRFATTFAALKNHKVFDVLPGGAAQSNSTPLWPHCRVARGSEWSASTSPVLTGP